MFLSGVHLGMQPRHRMAKAHFHMSGPVLHAKTTWGPSTAPIRKGNIALCRECRAWSGSSSKCCVLQFMHDDSMKHCKQRVIIMCHMEGGGGAVRRMSS